MVVQQYFFAQIVVAADEPVVVHHDAFAAVDSVFSEVPEAHEVLEGRLLEVRREVSDPGVLSDRRVEVEVEGPSPDEDAERAGAVVGKRHVESMPVVRQDHVESGQFFKRGFDHAGFVFDAVSEVLRDSRDACFVFAVRVRSDLAEAREDHMVMRLHKPRRLYVERRELHPAEVHVEDAGRIFVKLCLSDDLFHGCILPQNGPWQSAD